MNIKEMQQLIADTVICEPFTFVIKQFENGEDIYLQAEYDEPDTYTGKPARQHTRKWILSKHARKSEIIQTAFKCVLTSVEHQVREAFQYKGQRIFGPHFDVDALHELAEKGNLEFRAPVVPKEKTVEVEIWEHDSWSGAKKDEVREFDSLKEAQQFIKEFNAKNDKSEVPDYYETANLADTKYQ